MQLSLEVCEAFQSSKFLNKYNLKCMWAFFFNVPCDLHLNNINRSYVQETAVVMHICLVQFQPILPYITASCLRFPHMDYSVLLVFLNRSDGWVDKLTFPFSHTLAQSSTDAAGNLLHYWGGSTTFSVDSLGLDGSRSCLFKGLDALGDLMPPSFSTGVCIVRGCSVNVAALWVGSLCVLEMEKGSSQATVSFKEVAHRATSLECGYPSSAQYDLSPRAGLMMISKIKFQHLI